MNRILCLNSSIAAPLWLHHSIFTQAQNMVVEISRYCWQKSRLHPGNAPVVKIGKKMRNAIPAFVVLCANQPGTAQTREKRTDLTHSCQPQHCHLPRISIPLVEKSTLQVVTECTSSAFHLPQSNSPCNSHKSRKCNKAMSEHHE